MSSEEDENIRDLKERQKKEGRGRILSKLRNVGRRAKSRIQREQSVSSLSTENNVKEDEDYKWENIKIGRAESEFTETPLQTTDTVSSDQELVSLPNSFNIKLHFCESCCSLFIV